MVTPEITEEEWVCPECQHAQLRDGSFTWCGKNLQCPRCKEYNYYSEWTIQEKES